MSEYGPNLVIPQKASKQQYNSFKQYQRLADVMCKRVASFSKSLQASLVQRIQCFFNEVIASSSSSITSTSSSFQTIYDEQNDIKQSLEHTRFLELQNIFSQQNLKDQAQRILQENFSTSTQNFNNIVQVIKSETLPGDLQKYTQKGFDEFLKVSSHFVNSSLTRMWNSCKEGVELENQGCIEYCAMCLTHGIGVQADINKAKKLLQNGVRSGNLESLVTLGNFFIKGKPYVQKKNVNLGMFLLKRAAERGSLVANRELGDIYFSGNDLVQKNHKLAWLFYQICNKQIRIINLAQRIAYLQRQRSDEGSKTDDDDNQDESE